MDADDLRAHARCRRRFHRDSLGLAADLYEPRTRRSLRDGVVDHEGDIRIDPDVAVLGGAFHVEAGDVDGAQLGVVDEADRLVLRRAVWPDRGQAAAGLAGQIAPGCVVESHQITSNVLPMTSRASIARCASAA